MAMKLYMMPFLTLILTVSLFVNTVWGAYQLEYRIEVYIDGSATWIIEHIFLKGQDEALFRQLSDPTYFSDTFVKNIKSLVNATKEKTQRMNMTLENFVMTISVSGSYSIVKYQFRWRGFAEIENTRIKIGDVFEVENFFTYLYGDGAVYIKYPTEYIVESVSPTPHEQDYSIPMLEWYGIEDFGIEEPKIVIKEKSAASEFLDIISKNVILIIGLLALIGVGSVGLYHFKLRKKEMGPKMPEFLRILGMEDDEEKVVNLLKAAGGSLYQSAIADRCGFSRSKASKLLALMERKGKIRREKKGREKLVTLIYTVKESKSNADE